MTLGIYDGAGRYLGPAEVVIRFYPMDLRDKALRAPLVVVIAQQEAA